MRNLLYLLWGTILALALSILLSGCQHTRPAPVDAQPIQSAVADSQTAATKTKSHVSKAHTYAERLDAKATVILENWK